MDKEQLHKQLLQKQLRIAVKNHYGLSKVFELAREGVDVNAVIEKDNIIKIVDQAVSVDAIVKNIKPAQYSINLMQAFPSYLQNDVKFVADLIDFPCKHPMNNQIEVVVDNEVLFIPSRIYLTVDSCKNMPTTMLSDLQKTIINCLMTRHHNGYIREEFLKRIILSKYNFVIAFVLQLSGEYVIEILNEIYKHLDRLNINSYKEFIENNRKFYNLTKERIISYSGYYYGGKFKYKKDYVGYKILEFFYKSIET